MQLCEVLLVFLIDSEARHSKLIVDGFSEGIGQVAVGFLHFDENLAPLRELIRP